MLIRNATLADGTRTDVRVTAARITAMAPHLPAQGETQIIEAGGGALLPGLHDHHIHLFALAASLESLPCGPPHTAASLRAQLRAAPGTGWLRGTGYHDSVAGPIDRAWLDQSVPHRPVRLQHRSGRLWILNSAALAALAPTQNDPLERDSKGQITGRLYDADNWLRARLPPTTPNLRQASHNLAAHGITAATDVTPRNDAADFAAFAQARATGTLLQNIAVMGTESLAACANAPGCAVLGRKIHLHEGDYPDPAAFLATIASVRARNQQLAVHCVTAADLIFTLSLFEEAGHYNGYRIEHASLVPPDLPARIAATGARIVTQPHFIAERGDAYHAEIPASDHPSLYRAATLLRAGIRLAAGSDAPFGSPNPWHAMHAATTRRTQSGHILGPEEALTPEQALALYTSPWWDAGGTPRQVAVGQPADLCLLAQPWHQARTALAAIRPRATIRAGELIFAAESAAQTAPAHAA